MYRTITDFLADWQTEGEQTAKLFAAVTDEAKAMQIHPKVRTLERLAWHVTETITEMGSAAGLFNDNELEHQPVPATFAEIAALHQQYNARLAQNVSTRWTDANLTDELNMYGQTWNKGTVLKVLAQHEAHHRSQMTIIMRMVGLPVPGLYGPSQEEWAAMGMPAAK
jgi:uncharacterized damage-inducible protein DinB